MPATKLWVMKMAEIKLIALTGGPCGGKTAALTYLQQQLACCHTEVFPVYEQATALMQQGITPETAGVYDFHRRLFGNQLAEEEKALQQAKNSRAEKALVLCDRGLLDSRAYVSAEDFARYAALYDLTEAKIRNRYDAVLHLVTAADGAPAHYTLQNNDARGETAAQACALDQTLLSLWVGTQHLRVIDNHSDFDRKLARLKQEVLAVLGIPEPLEIERKFLISRPKPDLLEQLPFCRKIPLAQAYLNTPEEGRFRVRKRGSDENALYIKTVKHKISDLRRIEIETPITAEAYAAYLNNRACVEGIIAKDRYCFVWQSQYFELDIYPFWADRATLELELTDEREPYTLPDFLTVIRDVSSEKQYRNKYLAAVYKKLFTGF